MKKLFLLLALALMTNLAFASNGKPVKETEDKCKLELNNLAKTEFQKEGNGTCQLCGICNGTAVCVQCSCGNCTEAFAFLQARLCSLGCCGW